MDRNQNGQEWMENASAEQDAALAALEEKLRSLEDLRKKKKKAMLRPLITTVAFALVTIALFSAQTFAYFSESISANNQRIDGGQLDVELIEMMVDGGGSVEVYTDPVSVYPSAVVSKIVTVKNVGDLPAYIRIKLDKKVNDEASLPPDWQEQMVCGINWSDWEYADGYYYYKQSVAGGAETKALFETVSFLSSMGNEFMGKTLQLAVTVEATQANGNGSGPMNAVWR